MAYNQTNITETAPDWQASGAEPPATLKQQGFLSGYKPPAAYFNWFWKKVSSLLSQLRTAVINLQTYVTSHESKIIIAAESTVGYTQQLDGFYSDYHNSADHVIVTFTTTYSLFSWAGVPNGSYGEFDCKTGVVSFPAANVNFVRQGTRNYSVLNTLHIDPPDNSIPCAKLSDNILKCVYVENLVVNVISGITGEYQTYAAEDDDYYMLYIPAGGALATSAGDDLVRVDVHCGLAYIGAKVYKYSGSDWNLLS